MRRLFALLLGGILCLAGAAQAAEELVVLYHNQSTLPEKIQMGDWGFLPRTAETAVKPFDPIKISPRVFGLKITTLGRYQGTRFDFPQPIDTAAIFGVKNTYLELYIRPSAAAKAITTPGGPDTTGTPGNPPPPPTGAPPGEFTGGGPATPPPPTGAPPGEFVGGGPATPPPPTGAPPGEFVGGGPTPPGTDVIPGGQTDPNIPPELLADPRAKAPTIPLPALKNLRISFFTEKGMGLLVITPDQFYPKEEVGQNWIRIDIPLTLLNAALPVGGKLTRMLFTSDEPTEFYIGHMAFVADNDPLDVSTVVYPAFLEAGKRIFFGARVTAGLSHYETTWDFGTDDKPSVDAMGDRVTFTYDKEGRYTVVCTVRDLDGGKETKTQSFELKISTPQE